MDFLSTLEEEIAFQERLLEDNPVYIKLKALRELREVYVKSNSPFSRFARAAAALTEDRRPSVSGGKSLDAVVAVVEILRARGQPMKTAQLMPLIAERGITFAGNAPQNVLSSLLSRSSDVVSKGGHIGWALREWKSVEEESLDGTTPTDQSEPEAQGREAGPGGGT